MGMMDAKVKFIISELGETVDAFMLQLYAVLAEKERAMIAERTKSALAALKAKGTKLGHVTHKNASSIVLARLNGNLRNASLADDFSLKMKAPIERMLQVGMSLRAIAAEFNENGTKTVRGGSWTSTTVSNLMRRWA